VRFAEGSVLETAAAANLIEWEAAAVGGALV
jgi:hypothetical protein